MTRPGVQCSAAQGGQQALRDQQQADCWPALGRTRPGRGRGGPPAARAAALDSVRGLADLSPLAHECRGRVSVWPARDAVCPLGLFPQDGRWGRCQDEPGAAEAQAPASPFRGAEPAHLGRLPQQARWLPRLRGRLSPGIRLMCRNPAGSAQPWPPAFKGACCFHLPAGAPSPSRPPAPGREGSWLQDLGKPRAPNPGQQSDLQISSAWPHGAVAQTPESILVTVTELFGPRTFREPGSSRLAPLLLGRKRSPPVTGWGTLVSFLRKTLQTPNKPRDTKPGGLGTRCPLQCCAP